MSVATGLSASAFEELPLIVSRVTVYTVFNKPRRILSSNYTAQVSVCFTLALFAAAKLDVRAF